MFDLRLMRIRSFTAANTAMLFIGTSMGGAIFLLVIFLVDVLGYTELKAAVAAGKITLGDLVEFLANTVVAKHMFCVDRKFFSIFRYFF